MEKIWKLSGVTQTIGALASELHNQLLSQALGGECESGNMKELYVLKVGSREAILVFRCYVEHNPEWEEAYLSEESDEGEGGYMVFNDIELPDNIVESLAGGFVTDGSTEDGTCEAVCYYVSDDTYDAARSALGV